MSGLTKNREYIVNVKKFGARGDGLTDDTAAINAALGAGDQILFPPGVYLIAAGLNITSNKVLVGVASARIKLTAASAYVIRFDGSGAPATWIYGTGLQNLILDGNGFAADGLFLKHVINGAYTDIRVTNITGAGFVLDWAQLCRFDNPIVSRNYEAFTTTPVNGILIANNAASSANMFNNPTVEWVSGSGIKLQYALNNIIVGGTSEGCNIGIEFDGVAVQGNTIRGTDTETNTVADVRFGAGCAGNTLLAVQSSSATGIIFRGASDNKVYGGYAGGFDLDALSNRNKIDGVILFGAGAVVNDLGWQTTILDVFNLSTAVRIANKFAGGASLSVDGKIVGTAGADITGGSGIEGTVLWIKAGGLSAIGGATVANTVLTVRGADAAAGHCGLWVTQNTGIPILRVDNSGIVFSQDLFPHGDDSYYLGKNSNDSPAAWKGVILKDTTNGNRYRIEVISGVLTATLI